MSVTQDYKVVGSEISDLLGFDNYATLLDALLTRRDYLNKMLMADGKFLDWHDEKKRLNALLVKMGHGGMQ